MKGYRSAYEDPDTWASRGIHDDVKNGRPYTPWSMDFRRPEKKRDRSAVDKEYPDGDPLRGEGFDSAQQRFITKIVNSGDGSSPEVSVISSKLNASSTAP